MITVVDVIRDMQIEPTPELTWSVGNRVRDMYELRSGHLPEKRLRGKTDGSGGTHCFAVYPNEWRFHIEQIVRAHVVDAAKQLDMFR